MHVARIILGAQASMMIGYITEAGFALLDVMGATHPGEILAMVDPTNDASNHVIKKFGFEFWELAVVSGYLDNLYRRTSI